MCLDSFTGAGRSERHMIQDALASARRKRASYPGSWFGVMAKGRLRRFYPLTATLERFPRLWEGEHDFWVPATCEVR